MSVTLQSLRDQIVIDYKLAGNADFPSTRLNVYINQAQRYVQTQLNGLGMKRWEASISPTLSAAAFVSNANNVKYFPLSALSNASESPKAVQFIDVDDLVGTNAATYGQAFEVSPEEFNEAIKNSLLTPSLKDPKFMRLDNNFYLAPVGIVHAKAHYYKVVADLSGDNDATEIPTEFVEYIVKRVGIQVDELLNRVQNKEEKLSQLNTEIASAYDKFTSQQNELLRNKQMTKQKMQ